MKRIIVLLIVLMLFASGCARGEVAKDSEAPPTTITYGQILTREREATVRDYIATFEEMGMFEFYTMIENEDALEIWLDVGEEPITPDAVKGLTEGMIRDIADLFSGELSIRLTALQKGADSEITRFGTSVFLPDKKEVVYEPPQ